jgi:ribosomal protein S18 acetylase RimI-like enzyme
MVQQQILSAAPPTVYPVRWQQTLHLGAWRAGQLIGFLDVAVGQDSDSLHLPEYQPIGLIRFLALPERSDLVDDTVSVLLEAGERFWRGAGAGHVKAFHISTGYPAVQAGAGLLPGEWSEHFRVLTLAGFHLSERYYCLYRWLDQPIEEVFPIANLSLVYRGAPADRAYQLFYRRTDWIGSARMVRVDIGEQAFPIVYVTDLQIDPRWRRQSIGKWLLRRLINDATFQGYQQIVVHLAHGQHAAMNLLIQQGFQELNYRGYTLEKALTS